MQRRDDGAPKGTATVKFTRRDDALEAISALNGYVGLNGSQRPLQVKLAAEKSSDSSP